MKYQHILLLYICSIYSQILCTIDPLLVVLVMVKNEEAAMQQTLQPFIDAGIQSYLVLDTGSTDNTIAVTKSLFKCNNITQGYIAEQPFIDFATSRNYAFQCAEEKFPHAVFFLMIDAEWEAHNVQELIKFCANHIQDTYSVYTIRVIAPASNTMQYMPILTRAHKGIRYSGVVHESIITDTVCHLPDTINFTYNPTKYGEDKTKKRFLQDRDLLLAEYKKNPTNARNLFYLAQTYVSLNDLESARDYLLIRCSLTEGNLEEDFISHYRLGVIFDTLQDWQSALHYYLKAYNMRPTRAEPLVWLAYHYLLSKEYALSFLFAKKATEIPYPINDGLFIEKEMYEYMRYDVLGQVAGYLNEFEIGEAAIRKALVAHPDMPHLDANLDLYIKIQNSKKLE